MKKENILYIIVAFLALVVFVCFSQINLLKTNIDSLEYQLREDREMIEQQIANIHSNVDEQLKKQESLFSHTEFVFGNEIKDNKGAVTISVTPKVIADDTELKLMYKADTVIMNETDDGKYAGTVFVDMFNENEAFPLIKITSKGETKTEYLKELSLSGSWSAFLPELIGNGVIDVSKKYSGSKLPVRLIVEAGFNTPDNSTEVKFKDCYLLVEKNGMEIDRKDMNDKFRPLTAENNVTEFVFEDFYEISEDDSLLISIVGEDDFGFIHKQAVYNWVHPDKNGAQPEAAVPARFRGEFIYDKDGKLLFGKEI